MRKKERERERERVRERGRQKERDREIVEGDNSKKNEIERGEKKK